MSVQKLKRSQKDVGVSNESVSATVKKAFKKNSSWEDKVDRYIYSRLVEIPQGEIDHLAKCYTPYICC